MRRRKMPCLNIRPVDIPNPKPPPQRNLRFPRPGPTRRSPRARSLKPALSSHAKLCNHRSIPNCSCLHKLACLSISIDPWPVVFLLRRSSRGSSIEGLRHRSAMAHGIIGNYHHSVVASRVAMLAHVLFLTTAVLMLVWLLHFRGGINIQSQDPDQIFNVHPFVMSWGFILLIGEAILAYSTIPMDHRTQKMAHMLIHLVGLILAIFGVYAAFKFHDAAVSPDLTSLHSWLGIATLSLFALQWLFGFATFWLSGAAHEHTRAAAAPVHVMAGLAIFLLAVCTAQTGLVEKSAAAGSVGEARLINVTGIFILLYGVAVGSTVALRRAFL
ncbi:hypothetical protein EJB05_04862, partial [Eragrostis curvula]